MKENTKSRSKEAQQILDKYVAFAAKKGYHPTRTHLLKAGVSRDKLRHHFGTMNSLKDAARKYKPEVFKDIVDDSLFTPKAFRALREEAGKYSRYLVTTAVEGCDVHEGFFASINSYAEKRQTLPLIMSAADPASDRGFYLDSAFSKSHIVFDDLCLNDNIFLSSIKLSAKHIDPITGLSRIGQRNGSFIYASPKQRLKMTPTSNTKLPHAIMTTGAVTKSDYSTQRYMSERTAYIADHDHVLGGIIVEVVDDRLFHFRQVQSDRFGCFIDLATLYTPAGTTSIVRPEALVLGDWHSGETDPDAKKAFVDGPDSVLQLTKPKRLVVHDGFNGRSISHHEIHNLVLRAQRAAENHLNLQEELEVFAKDLEALAAHDFIEEIIIVKSNHDEFLDRYISEGRFMEDPQNCLIGAKLCQAMIGGQSPLRAAVEWLGIKNGHKLRWLERDEDYKIANIELGAHGDKGANGARGSIRAMENAYSNSVSGHAHTPEILRGAWQVGTTSLLKLNYNKGPSSWMHTSCLVYPNGMRQMINVIQGAWKLPD